MENEIKVSILVPVYGVEKYIEKCACSLFEQTMKDGIEFIFTDDCTPDSSIDILQMVLLRYPERQAQVRIIHHEKNLGLAEARVTGLNAARGEYVIHCDSDDWVEPDMYELMYAEAKRTDADIVGCDFIEELSTKSIIKNQNFELKQRDLLIEIIKGGQVEGFLWNRLIRKVFYKHGRYRADIGTTLFEDLAVTVPMHVFTHRVAYLHKPLYHYNRAIANSMSSNYDEKRIKSAIKVLSNLRSLPLHEIARKELINRFRLFLFLRAISFSDRKIHQWENCELIIATTIDLDYSRYERFTICLIKHKLYFLQYCLMLSSKMIRADFLKKIFEYILWKIELSKKG